MWLQFGTKPRLGTSLQERGCDRARPSMGVSSIPRANRTMRWRSQARGCYRRRASSLTHLSSLSLEPQRCVSNGAVET